MQESHEQDTHRNIDVGPILKSGDDSRSSITYMNTLFMQSNNSKQKQMIILNDDGDLNRSS